MPDLWRGSGRRHGGRPPKPPRRDSGPGPLRQQRQRRSMFERDFHELLENGMIRVDSTLKDEHMASHAAEIDRRLLVCGDLVGQGHFGNIYMGCLPLPLPPPWWLSTFLLWVNKPNKKNQTKKKASTTTTTHVAPPQPVGLHPLVTGWWRGAVYCHYVLWPRITFFLQGPTPGLRTT